MNRLAIILLTATALASAGAAFGQGTVQPPVKWEDTPNAQLRVPSAPVAPAPVARAPGVTWQQPPAAAVPQVRTRVAPAPGPMPQVRVQAAPAPHAGHSAPVHVEALRHGPSPQGPTRVEVHQRRGEAPIIHRERPAMRQDIFIHRGGERMERRHHGINRYPDYRRIDRGLMVPQYWWSPRFHVMNWGRYGLPQPMHGGRWVRYYDDALLVDDYGRVHDGRWGMRWDEYEDQWGYDDRGIPLYVGDGEYRPDGRDYRWVEEHQGRGSAHGYGHQRQGYGYPQHPGHPGYAGYGGMVVTETTVTTSPTVIEKTVYEEVVHSAPRRSYRAGSKGTRIRAKARCAC